MLWMDDYELLFLKTSCSLLAPFKGDSMTLENMTQLY